MNFYVYYSRIHFLTYMPRTYGNTSAQNHFIVQNDFWIINWMTLDLNYWYFCQKLQQWGGISEIWFYRGIGIDDFAGVYICNRPWLEFSLLKQWTGMVKELTGGYKIKYHANGVDKDPIEIDFTPPFRYNLFFPFRLIYVVSHFYFVMTFIGCCKLGGLTWLKDWSLWQILIYRKIFLAKLQINTW